ncbi:MAG: hypothetical protein FJ368_01510 [Pelagibacterales bacterium]|nr:hypothetical protein [Pelagibacterales bacterium]
MLKQLLPVGFYDLLFDEAEKNHKNINNAIDAFLAANYRLIKLPLVEFEESFNHNQKSGNYFQAIDVISGKNMIFRNDITPQLSRLLGGRLREENLPLKLCYVGDVLCAKNDDLYKDRQQTQVGVEIIGCDDEKSNFEIVQILLQVLEKISDKKQQEKLLIEFSLPNFLAAFLDELHLQNKEELSAAIVKKNISAIDKILETKKSSLIKKIMLNNHNLLELTAEILAEVKSEKIAIEIKRAQKIADFLSKNFPKIKVCFDLFGDDKNSYHQDIAFDVFYDDLSYAIARGGRYKINGKNGELNAVGATIYMNLLRKVA